MVWIGIDPGGSGGIAWITDNGVARAVPMPKTEADILAALWDCAASSRSPANGYAVVEHVWSTPGQGGAFKFGKSVGGLLMALTAVEIAFDQVIPRTWQKMLGVAYAKGLTDTEKKNLTKRRAQQLFPTLTITHATADALLMAEYCRRVHRGMNGHEGNGRGDEPRERSDHGRRGGDARRHTGAADDAGAAQPGERGRRVPVSTVEPGAAGRRGRDSGRARGCSKGNSPASA